MLDQAVILVDEMGNNSNAACLPAFACLGSNCGTSGTTGTVSSSSTGTSGTTGTTGTTGNCVGPGTQNDADCGGAHQVCGPGQTCQQYSSIFGNVYYACGCTQADSTQGTVDSCRKANDLPGGNGLVVCDSVTFGCRAPRDMEPVVSVPARGQAPCAPGYTSRSVSQADGGTVCVQPCNVNSDCTANFTTCTAGPTTLSLSDGGSETFDGYCTYNLCGPDVAPTSGVSYYGACNSAGQGDGICQPFAGATSYYGICFRSGSLPSSSACGGTLGPAAQSCVAGDLCIDDGQAPDPCSSNQTTFCLPTCNTNSPSSGPVTPPCPNFFGRQTTCQTFGNDPPGNALQAGVCY
jgi:hypothetical protein